MARYDHPHRDPHIRRGPYRYDTHFRHGAEFDPPHPRGFEPYGAGPRGMWRAREADAHNEYSPGYRGGPRGRHPRWVERAMTGAGERAPGGYAGWATPTLAGEIMTGNPRTVTPETSLAEAARHMRDLDVGLLPVVGVPEEGELRGVISDRDIAVRAAAEGRDMNEATVAEFMTDEVTTCHADDDIRHVFALMKRARVRRIPVLDDEGRLAGIIAQADLAVNYAREDPRREIEVEQVVERVSQPARPTRSGDPGGAYRYAAGGRGGDAGGGSGRDQRGRYTEERGLRRGGRSRYDRGW